MKSDDLALFWLGVVAVCMKCSPSSSLEAASFESWILSLRSSCLKEKRNLSFCFGDGPSFIFSYCKERRKGRSFNILVMD